MTDQKDSPRMRKKPAKQAKPGRQKKNGGPLARGHQPKLERVVYLRIATIRRPLFAGRLLSTQTMQVGLRNHFLVGCSRERGSILVG
jgi:hypothetical protein